MTPDLRVSVAGIELKNPVIAASGTFGYGVEFEDVVHLDRLGGFVVKGLSREPMIGNPPPRLYETAAGMLNAIGLQNIGARAFVDEKLPKLRQIKNTAVIANVFGYTREDYEHTIHILNEGEGIAAYELNVSCPNTQHGGIQFGSDPRSLDELVTSAKRFAQLLATLQGESAYLYVARVEGYYEVPSSYEANVSFSAYARHWLLPEELYVDENVGL